MRKAELIFIPTPAVSHLVPFLELARRLIDQDDRIRITVLLLKLPGQSHLDTYVNSIASSQPFVRFIDVPELEGKPTLGTQSVQAYVYNIIERNIPLVRNIIMGILLDGVTVKGIVADILCLPMIDIAKDATLPFYVFLTTSSGFLAMMQYLAYRHTKGSSSVFVRDSGEMLSIPGFVNPVPTKALPSSLFVEDSYDIYIKLAILFTKASGILVNTSSEIEPFSLNHFHHQQNFPSVYAVGPIFCLKAQPHPEQDLTRCYELMKWLDDQPEASVVFLCFGSKGNLRGPLVKEIAHGLELCQYRFLWSLRTDEVTSGDLLPEGFLDRVDGRGMICGWCPQVEILAHKAVGSFVSHCGWNSIVESLWFGVPIVTWPMFAEQQLNAFLMVKELNLAVKMRLDYREHSNKLVSANEIETAIRDVMNKDDNVVRKRVMDISQMARKATLTGGTSFAAIEKFIYDVIRTRT